MSAPSARPLGGRYQLRTLLGRGGMAAVWAGMDTRLERPVAVKVLEGAALADPASVRRLEAEAKTLARLAHPNIVAGYDVGTEDGVPFLVMELVEGNNLARRLDRGPLEVADAVAIAVQICDAVEAGHRSGVVHRDIKPANVLLAPTGVVKVCDFGIARWLRENRAGLTGPAGVIGTSEYMAPEQATGGEIDARTDLYAIGCVLYHMVAGRPPLTGDDPLRVLWRHVHEAPTSPAQVRPGVPVELDALVLAMLAKDPADRPASAREARDRLARLAPAAGSPTFADAADSSSAFPGAADSGDAGMTVARAAVSPHTAVMRPARNPTQTMPAVHVRDRFRLGPFGVTGVAVGAALTAAVAVGLAMAPDNAPPGPAGGAPASSSTTVSVAPTSGGTLDAVRAAVAAQLAASQLDRRAAGELGRELDAIERSLDRGDEDRAAERIDELRRRLGELRRDDRLTDGGHAAIVASLNDLAATLPDRDSDGGGDNDDRGDDD